MREIVQTVTFAITRTVQFCLIISPNSGNPPPLVNESAGSEIMDNLDFWAFGLFVRVNRAAGKNLGVSLICKGKKPAAGEKFGVFLL